MTFSFQGHDYQNSTLHPLFPFDVNTVPFYPLIALQKWIAEGNRVMVRLTEGARAGTLGELILPQNLMELYSPVKTAYNNFHRLNNGDIWTIKFDDSDKTVKLEGTYKKRPPGFLEFIQQPTVWVYTSKERPKIELPVLHDHFGVPLQVGQVCLALVGKGTSQYVRLGEITRWSEKATIWVKTMKTQASHPANSEVTVQGSVNIFVLDGDIRSKAMMAKLMFT